MYTPGKEDFESKKEGRPRNNKKEADKTRKKDSGKENQDKKGTTDWAVPEGTRDNLKTLRFVPHWYLEKI